MICQNCKTFYVRDPCPNCGADSNKLRMKENKSQESSLNDDSVKPSQLQKRGSKSGSQVLMQKSDDEEKLVKPSERFKTEQEKDENRPSFQRFEQSQGEGEQLVRPSERLKQDRNEEDIPSFQRFDREVSSPTSSTPTKISKKDKDDEIPSFQRYQPEGEVNVSNISKLNKPDQQEKLKNDKEYRNQVKETLEEVMGLLEKLIEDD